MRVAAVGDLHYTRASKGLLRKAFADLDRRADVLLLCGDLTDYGLPDEAQLLADDLRAIDIPVVAVLGNHDLESGRAEEVRHILQDARVEILDGDACEVQGVGFAGVKGFGGGFGRHSLEPWGEEVLKSFVHGAVDEALKLDRALSRLHTAARVVLMHYAPVRDTVAGEAVEIYPFLGSSRLEEPLNRHGVRAVFHGHAHHGTTEGRTTAGIPVYNVAMPLLRRTFPDHPPFRVVEIDAGGDGENDTGG